MPNSLQISGLAISVQDMKSSIWLWLPLSTPAQWAVAMQFTDTSNGEASFVSRPDLKPAMLNITTYQPDLISSGSWFHAPFDITSVRKSHSYIPGQFGPHIFDSHGDLVWSGALLFNRSNVFDFRKTRYRGSDALSLILSDTSSAPIGEASGRGIILDSSYRIIRTVLAGGARGYIDMHEFNVIDDGNSALLIVVRKREPGQSLFEENVNEGARDTGFQEVDIETGTTIFEWWPFDHIPKSHTHSKDRSDAYHVNSVDKTPQGHYLISARHTSTIYLVSGDDGSIIWQLGGPHTSFVHTDDFNFSSQHHARVWSQNTTHTIVSFLDNAADESIATAASSSALLVSLSTATAPMIATVLRKWGRPDGKLSYRRGNVQFLPNENLLAGWADFGYTSEFTLDGVLVQEVHSLCDRFSEYRQYKFDWTAAARVSEPIALVSRLYRATEDASTTALYVSWNGATEVASWNFYGSETSQLFSLPSLLATTPKRGFETVAMITGYHPFVFVEAVDKDGISLQNSSIMVTELPPSYIYGHEVMPAQSAVSSDGMGEVGLASSEDLVLPQHWLLLLLSTVLSALVVYGSIRLWRSHSAGLPFVVA